MATLTKKRANNELDLDAMGLDTDPSICCMSGVIEFAEEPDKAESQNLRLKLYDGGINHHWYFGNLAFELDSMKLEKSRVPILLDHDTGVRLGYSTKAIIDTAFVLEGRFLKNDSEAQNIRAQAKEGFPFEASLRFDFDRATQVVVPEGTSEQVNGRTIKGPGTIVKNAIIKEGSVCTFGALKGCRSQVFNHQEKEHTMLTLEEFKADNEALYKEVFALGFADAKTKGEANERAIFSELKEACGDDHTLLVACYSEGKTVADAFKMRAAKMKAANEALQSELAEAKKTPGKPEDRAADEFSDAEDKQKAAAALKAKGDTFDAKSASDEELKAHFQATQDLKDQFTCADAYVASVKHA